MLKVSTFLKNKRTIFFGFAAGLMAFTALTLAMPQSASAVVSSGTRQVWVGNHTGVFIWNESNDSLSLTSAPATLPSGYCADAIFDWARDDYNPLTSDHHDARIVRSCRSNSTHNVQIASDTGGSLRGMQKAGLCVGPDQNVIDAGTCANASGADQSVKYAGINDSLPNNCVRAWKKFANGTTAYYSGGSSTSCSS